MLISGKSRKPKAFTVSIPFYIFVDPLAATVGSLSFILMLLTLSVKEQAAPVLITGQERVMGLELPPDTLFIEVRKEDVVLWAMVKDKDDYVVKQQDIYMDSPVLDPLISNIKKQNENDKEAQIMAYKREGCSRTFNLLKNTLDDMHLQFNLMSEQLPENQNVASILSKDGEAETYRRKMADLMKEGVTKDKGQ